MVICYTHGRVGPYSWKWPRLLPLVISNDRGVRSPSSSEAYVVCVCEYSSSTICTYLYSHKVITSTYIYTSLPFSHISPPHPLTSSSTTTVPAGCCSVRFTCTSSTIMPSLTNIGTLSLRFSTTPIQNGLGRNQLISIPLMFSHDLSVAVGDLAITPPNQPSRHVQTLSYKETPIRNLLHIHLPTDQIQPP